MNTVIIPGIYSVKGSHTSPEHPSPQPPGTCHSILSPRPQSVGITSSFKPTPNLHPHNKAPSQQPQRHREPTPKRDKPTMSFAAANKRLLKEYKALLKESPDGIAAGPIDESNLFEWECLIQGPEETPFEGGVFPATLSFPKVCLFVFSFIIYLAQDGNIELSST